MESDFYRTALIRNFLAKLIRDGLSAFDRATEMDRERVCSTSEDEIRTLLEGTAEYIIGRKLEKDEVDSLTNRIVKWCRGEVP
ncbi:hypothetical protein [Metallosphaera hakonensis]|uniref:Uncharacterized protein n=1 Tax=Metallosphaera hakonensis JCM 8857 = DSM 7519 TaxID=1293036 RepID=A0A2U9ISR7_9CREN|nr:hypothetical protein [Metallosphaera hakonensis]AWR99089.1 hypothetical protein DFR87_04595 [Metallosphaera hakonensis JCM 8857 = DSM 7519]